VTVLCIWAKAIALFGIIYVWYKRFFEATEEAEKDLEAGAISDEGYEELRKEKENSLKSWARSGRSTLI
jgi:hypothetical protein